MKQLRLMEKVAAVGREDARLGAWKTVAASCAAAVLAGLACTGVAWTGSIPRAWSLWAALAVMLVGLTVGFVRAHRRAQETGRVAHSIERAYPELEGRLVTALEQRPHAGRFGFLQETVIAEALAHGIRNDWRRAVPGRSVRRARAGGLAALACLCAFALFVGTASAPRGSASKTRIAAAPPVDSVKVDPGDAAVERGASLVVTARFTGTVPQEAALLCENLVGGEATTLPMSRSLSDPLFGARVDAVKQDFTYRVTYETGASKRYRVKVFQYPELVRADAQLEFPAYTGMGTKTIEDTRRVSVVEGTRVTFLFTLNKPVAEARLVDDKKAVSVCAVDPADATRYRFSWVPAASVRLRLQLRDEEGRANKRPPELAVTVTANRRPDVALAAPSRDMRVSPLEELRLKASVWDDFGVASYGIAFGAAGVSPAEAVLGGVGAANERRALDHMLDFEALGAKPDQLFSYYFWADDIGPDGQPRRTFGDMYFAEVRHFEEIFRQGEEAAGGEQEAREDERRQDQEGQGDAARRAEDLAERQKEIVNATWKVLRRETGAALSSQFAEDGGRIAASQQELLTQASGLDTGLQDAESKAKLAEVVTHMQRAFEELTSAVDKASLDPLRAALSSEQAAYQALLALRAREHSVARGREQQQQSRRNSASGAGSRSQQQLDQLQLSNERNRYETERQARPRTADARRENNEVLDRVRDLAQRQKDVNERMKELQSQLAEAASAQAREELARQLARLRDQQQELVRSADELGERMSRPENQERMADARERLGETRENMRQASEAMDEAQLAQAVARGTRAERELSEMRERFRADAANRFAEDAQRLREDARTLDANEKKLAERLEELGRAQRSSLRGADDQTNLGRDFKEQGESLDKLLTAMEETVKASEEAEPLMSRQLYDTLRTSRQQRVGEAIDATRQLVENGIVDQARTVEANAGRSIQELRAGVEKAAERVLGDGNETLRRARDSLSDLAQEVGGELAREGATEGQAREGGDQAREDRAAAGKERRQEGEAQARAGEGQRKEGDAQARAGEGQRKEGDAQARAGDMERFREGGERTAAPMGGEDFVRWSDRLRDVEDMLDAPDLRAEAAVIRERARAIRREGRSSSTGLNWGLVRTEVAEPLNELRDRVADELARRTVRESLVPIDRDPVPPKYADSVRRYYEELGRGK